MALPPSPALLVTFGGLPGVGKTTLARLLAKRLAAVYLRIDTIEQALRNATGVAPATEGYEVAYALAAENLALGEAVIADSVNPLPVTRSAWRSVAARAGARIFEVEVVCSDLTEHQRRVETRAADLPGQVLPSWQDVLRREYQPFEGHHCLLDTLRLSPTEALQQILAGVTATSLIEREEGAHAQSCAQHPFSGRA